MRVPGADMRRHHDARAVGKLGRLVGRGRGLALHRRLGLDDLQRHARRQLDADRRLVEDRQDDLHPFLQPLRLIADDVGGNLDLVVGLGVHEVIAVGVGIEEVVILVLDEGALDLLGGLEAVGHLHAVGKAAHVDLRRRRALAGMKAFGRKDDAELTVLPLDDIALANRACDNFHLPYPQNWRARSRGGDFVLKRSACANAARTIPISPPKAR